MHVGKDEQDSLRSDGYDAQANTLVHLCCALFRIDAAPMPVSVCPWPAYLASAQGDQRLGQRLVGRADDQRADGLAAIDAQRLFSG